MVSDSRLILEILHAIVVGQPPTVGLDLVNPISPPSPPPPPPPPANMCEALQLVPIPTMNGDYVIKITDGAASMKDA
jgi:hypothetical protein